MSFPKVTDQMVLLMEEILVDMPKAVEKGNKTAAQRIRTKSVRLTKVAKEWRRLSLEQEQKKRGKKKTAVKSTLRKKTAPKKN